MRWMKILAGLFLAGGLTAYPALAQRTTAPQPPNNDRFGTPTGNARRYQDYLFGVIGKIGNHSIVLNKTKFGIPRTISLDRKTKFARNGKHSSAAQLKVGEMVYVDVKTDKKTGKLFARKVVSGIDVTGP
ncbi:MAG: hypothetical protein ACRD1O_09480 [Terriglobia bacterium]